MELINYKDNCRVCFKSQCALKNIFTYILEGSQDTVDKIISSLFAVKLNTHSAFPQLICRKCLIEIENILLFKESLVRNEQILYDAFCSSRSSNQEDSGLNNSSSIITVCESVLAVKTEETDLQPDRVEQNVQSNEANKNCLAEVVKNEVSNSKENPGNSEENPQENPGTSKNAQHFSFSPSIFKASFLQNFNLISQHDAKALKQNGAKETQRPNSRSLPIKQSAFKKNRSQCKNKNNAVSGRSYSFRLRYGHRKALDNNKVSSENNNVNISLDDRRDVLKGCEYENNNNINAQSVMVAPVKSDKARRATVKTLRVSLRRLSILSSTRLSPKRKTRVFCPTTDEDCNKKKKPVLGLSSGKILTLQALIENIKSYDEVKNNHIIVNKHKKKVPKSKVQKKSSKTLENKLKNKNQCTRRRKSEGGEKVTSKKQIATKESKVVNKEIIEEDTSSAKKVVAAKKELNINSVANETVSKLTEKPTNVSKRLSNNDAQSPVKNEIIKTLEENTKKQLKKDIPVRKEVIRESSIATNKNDCGDKTKKNSPVKDEAVPNSIKDTTNISEKQLKKGAPMKKDLLNSVANEIVNKSTDKLTDVSKKLSKVNDVKNEIIQLKKEVAVKKEIVKKSSNAKLSKNDSKKCTTPKSSVKDKMVPGPTKSCDKAAKASKKQLKTKGVVKHPITVKIKSLKKGSIVKKKIVDTPIKSLVNKSAKKLKTATLEQKEAAKSSLIDEAKKVALKKKLNLDQEECPVKNKIKTPAKSIEEKTKPAKKVKAEALVQKDEVKKVAVVKKKLKLDQEFPVMNKIETPTKSIEEKINSAKKLKNMAKLIDEAKTVAGVKKKLNLDQECLVTSKVKTPTKSIEDKIESAKKLKTVVQKEAALIDEAKKVAVKKRLKLNQECPVTVPTKPIAKQITSTKNDSDGKAKKLAPVLSNPIKETPHSPRKQLKAIAVVKEEIEVVNEAIKSTPKKHSMEDTMMAKSSTEKKDSPAKTNSAISRHSEDQDGPSAMPRKRHRTNDDVFCIHEFYLIDDLALAERLEIKREEDGPPRKRALKSNVSPQITEEDSELENFRLQISDSEPETPKVRRGIKKLEACSHTWHNELELCVPQEGASKCKRNVRAPLRFSPKIKEKRKK